MGRGKRLDEKEKGKIEQLSSLKWSNRQIALEIGRSKHVVDVYLKNPDDYGKRHSTGRPKAVGKRTLKKIIKKASNKSVTSSKIHASLGLSVTPRTVQNYLKSDGNLVYTKMKGKPELTPEHKIKRFEMAVKWVTKTTKWHRVIFSDEKKFNLDSPDGYKYYWHHVDSTKITYSRRVQGGGSVMIWVAFCYAAKTPVIFISETMNAVYYTRLLNQNLLPFGESVLDNNYIFQQDNAPCHRANITQEWFENKGIDVFDWPARSPDLNPVENLFGLLAMKVYECGRQYSSISSLKSAIMLAWNEISQDTLHNLINSMQERMLQVIKSHGDTINY